MARLAPSRPAACDCELHQLMQLTQAACRRACARHLARSESAADCPPGRLFSAVRRQGPGAGCNSCTLPIRVVGEDGKSYPERRRISARSAFPESNPDGSGPEPASKPDVDPVLEPAVSAAADPEVRGSVASRCRAQRSTARPSPTRCLGLAVHSRASVLRTVRTGSCRCSRSMRATSFVQEGSD